MASIEQHLHFIKPDGSQLLFSLFAREDALLSHPGCKHRPNPSFSWHHHHLYLQRPPRCKSKVYVQANWRGPVKPVAERLWLPAGGYTNLYEFDASTSQSAYEEKLQIEFLLKGTKGSLSCGKEAEKYKACYPALKGWPLQITLVPEKESIGDEICFEFRVIENCKDKEK